MATEWSMPRRSTCCLGCGEAFEIGQDIIAQLVAAEDGYARRDYCTTCAIPDNAKPLATWRTQRPEPARPTQPTALDLNAAVGLLDGLAEDESPERGQLRFVLALLLWRKKLLKYAATETNDDGETWVFAHAKGDATYRVAKPSLSEDELDALSGQLEALLRGEVVLDDEAAHDDSDQNTAEQPSAEEREAVS